MMLNGIFAMSEIALPTARRARLSRLVEEGDAAAAVASRPHDEPTHFLSTIQIGITSIGVLNGIVGESVPKRIGQFDPEETARLVARPRHHLALFTYPFVRLLTWSTDDTLLWLLGQKAPARQGVTEEEIRAIMPAADNEIPSN